MSTEEEFAAFLAREDGEPADAEHAVRLRALLGDEALWAEPPAALEDLVVQRIIDEAASVSALDDRRRPGTRVAALVAGLAAVATLVVAIAVATRGEGYTVAINGTELAAVASGVVTVEETGAGYALELNVDGLAPAPEGFYYQGWVRGDGLGVSVGTFHARQSGEPILLWSGVDVHEYRTLNITIQEEGAGPASSGQVVMTAELFRP